MELTDYRTVGRSGLRVSPLTLGTMTFGDPRWGADAATAETIIDLYIAAGGNALDTANGYTEGRSEEIIGSWLGKHPGQRDRLVLATKFTTNLIPGDPNGGGAGRKALVRQLEASLTRLGTDYLDLYWVHTYDPHTPLEETLSALDDLVRAGKVRYLGMSNTPAWAVARSATVAELRGWNPIAAIQVEYSLLQRTVEGELFGAAESLGLGVIAWSPLAGGVLSGKYTRDERRPTASGRAALGESPYLTESTFEVLDALADIAGAVGSDIASVALAWVRQQAPVTTTLIGARIPAQLEANLASLRTQVPADALARLDRLTTPQLGFPFGSLQAAARNMQQAGSTVNGIASTAFTRG